MQLVHVTSFLAGTHSHLDNIYSLEIGVIGGQVSLYSGSMADGGVNVFHLADGVSASWIDEQSYTRLTGTYSLAALDFVMLSGQSMLLASGAHDDRLGMLSVLADGSIGQPLIAQADAGVLASVTDAMGLTVGGQDMVVVARANDPSLEVYSNIGTTHLTLADSIADSPKTPVHDITGLLSVDVGTTSYMIAASGSAAGVSSYRMAADGSATFVDMLGPAEGLPVSQISALASVNVAGTDFVLVAGMGSSSISSLRLNPMGVFFLQDHVLDSLDTRFAHVSALSTFTTDGRSFVLAGGSDDGVTLLEVGPDGRLHLEGSWADQPGWTLNNVTAIAATVIGTHAQVFVSGAGTAGITQFQIDLGALGGLQIATPAGSTLNGTARDDFLQGGAGPDHLNGGGGADRLVDGAGSDVLSGGAGADVFVFTHDGAADTVTDFQPGTDRLDVSDWGMIYTAAALTITQTATGAQVGYGNEELTLITADHTPINPASLTDADFIFF